MDTKLLTFKALTLIITIIEGEICPNTGERGWILGMQDEVKVRRERFIADYRNDTNKYKNYADYVLKMVQDALKVRQIEIAYASAREKTPESLEKKCKKQVKDNNGNFVNKYTDFRSEIMDLAGVRIVTYLLDDIDHVSKIIQELFEVLEEHSGNKLDLLGADRIGYLSVHYIVKLKDETIIAGTEEFKGIKCEIQVRTVLEDAWAQIFHDRQYKNELEMIDSDRLLRRTNLLSGNLELLDYQINGLVKEYDNLNQVERSRNLRNILEKPITKENVLSYFDVRLSKKTVFYNYERIESLLKEFGIKKIRDLESVLKDSHSEEKLETYQKLLTADKIISLILIINDSNKFFKKVGDSIIISKESCDFLEEFIDIKKQCNKYKVKILSGGKC